MFGAVEDVIVIGAGPAGSAAANLLAQGGHRVLVLEAAYFPRFHIGESLLPSELAITERLGVDLDGVPFLRKRGAVFIDERDGRRATFSFDEGLPGTPDHAHQVDRATFDHELLRAAERAGALVLQGHRVVEVEVGDRDVRVVADIVDERGRATGESFEAKGRYLVDASGQKAMLARRDHTLEPYRDFGRAAAFCRFDGLRPEIVAELHERGDIIVKIIEDGWMWAIPMLEGLSVGLVKTTGRMRPQLLVDAVAGSPLLSRLTKDARRGPVGLAGNFSYRNVTPYGARYACIGDAAHFLDPVFSSGVALALAGAERLADHLAPALTQGREADPKLMVEAEAEMAVAYEAFRRFIHRFYHTRLVDNVLLGNHHTGQNFRAGVISVLAADVWRDDNPFQNMLLRARRYG